MRLISNDFAFIYLRVVVRGDGDDKQKTGLQTTQ